MEKKQDLRKGDFVKFGESIGLSLNTINKMINYLISFENRFIEEVKLSLIDDDQKELLIELIKERIDRLK